MGLGILKTKEKPVAFKPSVEYKGKFETKIEKKDFFAGVISYGKRIIKTGATSTSGLTEIYKVPAGKIFFLIAANISVLTTGIAGGNFAALRISPGNVTSETDLLQISYPDVDNAQSFLSNSLSIPLKFTPEEIINLFLQTSGPVARASIQGYEIDASVLPLFT